MRLRALSLAAASVLCVCAFSPAARSDPLPSLDLRGLQPPTDPRGSLYMEPPSTPGPWAWNSSGWLSYGWRPVVLRDAAGNLVNKLVDHQLSFDFVAGLGLGTRAAVGIGVPSVLLQTGDSSPATARVMSDSSRPDQALGDMALTGKVSIVPQSDMGGFGLAALGRVTLPTGDRTSFVGEGAVTSELRLLAEMRLIAVAVQGSAGFKVRTEHRTFAHQTWGEEIPWGAALVIRPQAFGWDDRARWTWFIESHGSLPAGPSAPFSNAALSPVAVGASVRYAIRDLALLGGMEGPLDKGVGIPALRAIVSLQWAPRSHDADSDGVDDDIDECPDLPEDRDGFEDDDGCPDFDNDDDGVPDAQDQCPKQKEDEDGFQDDDGCPDADNDRDAVPDAKDACPDQPGPHRADPKTSGCPDVDGDKDGISDAADRCPNDPEDTDGFQDEDGCPDLDNDGDGVRDREDLCPNQPGPASPNPKLNGCPIRDQDGDTFDDDRDRCPAEPEVWNGIRDEDGCPDVGGKPLVTVVARATGPALQLLTPIRFKGPGEAPDVDEASVPTVRAIAAQLNRQPDWVVAVGAREAPQQGLWASSYALSRSFAVVLALRAYTSRDGVAETVGWAAVQDQPGARTSGLGFLVLGATQAQEPTVAPAQILAPTHSRPRRWR
jgi:OmpA-OmpF porin, OOP family